MRFSSVVVRSPWPTRHIVLFELSISSNLSNLPFSAHITHSLSLQPNYLIPIKQLRAYLRYAAVDVERYIKKNYDNLVSYLAIYPTVFYVMDEYVGLASAKTTMQKRGFDLNKSETISLEERLIKRVQYIEDVETGKAVRDLILSSDVKLIAFDSEGKCATRKQT